MYNQLLSDMGLNISAAPDRPAETAQPPAAPQVAAEPEPPQIVPQRRVIQSARQQQVIRPAVPQASRPVAASLPTKGSGNTKWLILGGIAIAVLFIAVVIVAVAAFIIWKQYS